MSKVSVSKAALLTGKSKETINLATNSGKISYTLNQSGHKVIDIAELERVYPLVKSMDEIEESGKVSNSQPDTNSDASDKDAQIALLRLKLESAQMLNETLTSERQRERNQLENEIENLRSSLEKSQDQHSKAMLLITDQSSSKNDDLEMTMRALENRISNQEAVTEEQKKRELRIRKKYRQMKEALEEEKQKSFLKKIFG